MSQQDNVDTQVEPAEAIDDEPIYDLDTVKAAKVCFSYTCQLLDSYRCRLS
jgi:hypothetical protein